MTSRIRGAAHLLGDDVNTDIHCSAKYFPGKNTADMVQHAFERLAPGFSLHVKPGDVVVAGRNFGINSSREQAVHILRTMGIAALIAQSFGRQFFRNCINNGLPAVECDISGIRAGDEVEVDLIGGTVADAASGIARKVTPLPSEVQALLAAGGLIPFIKRHPDWQLTSGDR
jgi:3-isopropylmalate dehydratase small subunit